MVEEHKMITGNNMMQVSTTKLGFDPYVNSDFFNFEQHNNNNNNNNNSDLFYKPSSSSSKPSILAGTIAGAGAGDFSQFDERCVLIPCEPNETPSQGLSLSLSSTNPSTIGIQSFQLVRPPQNYHNHLHHMYMHEQQHNMMMTDDHQHQTTQYSLTSSKYLVPTQDLLNEFCNLGAKEKAQRTTNQFQDHDHNYSNNMNASSSKNIPLSSVEFLELQKRKSKLLHMLDEVDRKYHNYCDQMKAVVSSFEAVAGNGAATVYSALASKAMSRHFRCLRDGIVGQIKVTKKAMGEKDISAPGATRGETPRLRLLDQTLRQQRAFQHMITMDSHPWRPQRGLPERSVSILRAWLFEHFLHPYPSDVDKHILARQTGLSRSQVSNWFINARVRLWKPMVEEMYVEETKDNNDHENIEGVADRFNLASDENAMITKAEQKPTVDQLIRRDSDCLSSIINHHDHHSFPRVSTDSFGAVELDFSAYNHNFRGGGGDGGSGGVSLNLGLQQHASGGGGGDCGGGVSLYQYSSLLDGDQGQNLPYRNLMGAQLLNDNLAG